MFPLPTTTTPPRILVMEDEPDVLDLYETLLSQEGYKVYRSRSLQEARALLRQHTFDLFLSDILLEDGRGTDLLRDLMPRLKAKGTRIVLASGAARYRALSDELGADLFLTKPFDIMSLVELVQRLLIPPTPATTA